MNNIFDNEKLCMNITEIKAFTYLIEEMGYSEDDIKFYYNTSPDFMTLDSYGYYGYEVKLKIGHNIYFHKNQFEKLKEMNNVDILVFKDDEDVPISIFPVSLLSEDKIIDGIKIRVMGEIKETTLTIDEDAKDLIKQTQKVIHDRKNIKMDLKDLVHLVFKNPDDAANLVSKNFNSEIDKDGYIKIMEM